MERKLLLICNPGTPGVNYVQHVPDILNRYKSFFKSPVGGYWSDREICEMPNGFDSKAQVTWLAIQLADLAKNYEYSTIVFVGHGGNYINKDIIQLSGGGIVNVQDLIMAPGYEHLLKRTIIVDACRSLVGPTADQMLLESRSFSGEGQIEGDMCKEYYNSIIGAAEPHVELIQSTRYGEPAIVTATGSAFSDSIFEVLNQKIPEWNTLALGDRCGQLCKGNKEVLDLTSPLMKGFSQVPEFTRLGGHGDFPLYAVWRPVTRIL